MRSLRFPNAALLPRKHEGRNESGGTCFTARSRMFIGSSMKSMRSCKLEVPAAIRSLKINAVRTSFESPWQNGVAERWVGSCRRQLLDHVIALNERPLKRLLVEYVSYHHEDRTHLGLGKATPVCRTRCLISGRMLSHDRLGGLHHRYDRAA